jgi:hypothetical protein
MRLGDRTSGLLGAAFKSDDSVRTVLYMTADIAQAAIGVLFAAGIDVRGDLASTYLMPEDIA